MKALCLALALTLFGLWVCFVRIVPDRPEWQKFGCKETYRDTGECR